MALFLSQADLVIKGKVLNETDAIRNDERGSIETVYTIQVSQVLKGNTSLATVEVHTAGGEIDGVISSVSHGSSLANGQLGIFLLSPLPTGGYYLQGANAGKITRLKYDEDYEAIHWGEMDKYKSWRQLREQVGVLLGVDLTINPLSKSELQTLTNPTEFCVKLDNPEPNIEDMTVEFDVMAKSSVQGLKFARAEVLITYPTGNLGDFIVDQEKIEAEKGDITESPAYSIEVEDKSEDQIELSIESPCDNTEPHYVLDTVYEKLATLIVEVNDWGDFGTMNVNEFAVAGTAEYVNPAALLGTPGCTEFDELCGEGEFIMDPCVITSISSSPTSAGTGQTLTIEGQNFGNGALGEILFPNADDGGRTAISINGLDPEVIIRWSPNEIIVRVESNNAFASSGVRPFGSGKMIIDPMINSMDPRTLVCNQSIVIDYAIANEYDEDSEFDKAVALAFLDSESSNGDIVYYLDETIDQSSDLTGQDITFDLVEEMLLDVLCKFEVASGANLVYGGASTRGNISSGETFIGFTADPNPMLSGELGLTDVQSSNTCSFDPSVLFYGRRSSRVEVLISNFPDDQNTTTIKWNTDYQSTSVNSNEYDLYSTLMHEVGHSLLMKHAQRDDDPDTNDQVLMFYNQSNGEFNRNIDQYTAAGLSWLISNSKSDQSGGCHDDFNLNTNIGERPNFSSSISEPHSKGTIEGYIVDYMFNVNLGPEINGYELYNINGSLMLNESASNILRLDSRCVSGVYFLSKMNINGTKERGYVFVK